MHNKISKIKKLSQDVNFRINLFEGYSPKKIDSYKGELLFWRQIVNIYGLFADCDKVQIKERRNLIDLMKRYSLIEKREYDVANTFCNDVSELRKWFCHNNDTSLYYASNRQRRIEGYLDRTFILATYKPNSLDCIQPKEWDILTFDIERRFEEYLDILIKGFTKWRESEYIEDLLQEWIYILSFALFSDKELIQNTLADIAKYDIINHRLQARVPALAKDYYSKLVIGGYCEKHIEYILTDIMTSKLSNKGIITESIRLGNFI